jgi:O-antigen/teichoic acid export membrane protein
MVGFLALYPVINARWGIDTLGLWSLLLALPTYVSLADVGFSQLIAREAGPDGDEEAQQRTQADVTAALTMYAIISVPVIVLGAGIGLLLPVPAAVARESVIFCSALAAGAALAGLAGRVYGGVLSAFRQNSFVLGFGAAGSAMTLAVSALFVLIDRPFEGLGLGLLLPAAAQLYIMRRRALRLLGSGQRNGLAARIGRAGGLVRRGRTLYLTGLGFWLREPTFRLVAAATTGLSGAAIVDIGLRVTAVVREVVVAGFGSLYPSFAYLLRQGNRRAVAELALDAVLVGTALGGLAFGVLAWASPPLLRAWLSSATPELDTVVRVLAAWGLLTILNAPAWHLLLAARLERWAATAIAAHTGAILLLVPLSYVSPLDPTGLALYWLIASVPTQGLIFVVLHAHLGLVRSTYLSPRSLILLAAAAMLFTASVFVRIPFVYLALVCSYAAVASITSWPSWHRFLLPLVATRSVDLHVEVVDQ